MAKNEALLLAEELLRRIKQLTSSLREKLERQAENVAYPPTNKGDRKPD
jgi:hypothetical protein